MESLEEINKLAGGLRHLRIRDADESAKYAIPVKNVPRPGFNPTGKEIEVSMNAFRITDFPTKNVYQYDVSIPFALGIIQPILTKPTGSNRQWCGEERCHQQGLEFQHQKTISEVHYL